MDLPILGYRTIAFNQGRWESPFRRIQIWQSGPNHASCYNSHPCPQDACECGLYAYHTLTAALNDIRPGAYHLRDEPLLPTIVVGCIGYGNVCIHTDRWRSEILEPIAIFSHEYFSQDLLAQAQDYFNIPIIPPEQFTSFLSEFGNIKFKNSLPPPPAPLPHWTRFNRAELSIQLSHCQDLIEKIEEARLSKKALSPPVLKALLDFVKLTSTALSLKGEVDTYLLHHWLCSFQGELISLLSRRRPALSGEYRRCLQLLSRSLSREEIALRLGYPANWDNLIEEIALEASKLLRTYQQREGEPPDLKSPQFLLASYSPG